MKLSECKLGEIVVKTNGFDEYDKSEIGHIVGLSRVFYSVGNGEMGYTVEPIVKFADKEPQVINRHNIEKLEE